MNYCGLEKYQIERFQLVFQSADIKIRIFNGIYEEYLVVVVKMRRPTRVVRSGRLIDGMIKSYGIVFHKIMITYLCRKCNIFQQKLPLFLNIFYDIIGSII